MTAKTPALGIRLPQEVISFLGALGRPLGMTATAYARHVIMGHVVTARGAAQQGAQPLSRVLSTSLSTVLSGDTLKSSSSLSSPPDPGSCTPSLSSTASGPTLADQGIDTQAVCSECRRLFVELRSVHIHPFDTDFDRAVVERLTGISLRADAGGLATPDQIYAVIREACSGYGRRQLYPATVIRGTSFWANYAKASATDPPDADPPIPEEDHPLAWMIPGTQAHADAERERKERNRA